MNMNSFCCVLDLTLKPHGSSSVKKKDRRPKMADPGKSKALLEWVRIKF